MTYEERYFSLKVKRNQLDQKRAAIKQLEIEIDVTKKEMFNAQWVKCSWDRLKSYLDNKAGETLLVTNENSFVVATAKQINESGDLTIGGYTINDHFKPGEDLYVDYASELGRELIKEVKE